MASLSREELQKLISVNDVAKLFEVRPGIVRREAKKDNIPGAYLMIGKYGFDPEEVMAWEPPVAGTRTVGAKREDGRQRYAIWLTLEEHAGLSPDYEMTNPRERAAARRAAKKAAAAEAPAATAGEADATVEVATENPFATFEE